MAKVNHNIFNIKYHTLKTNIHLMKVQNKKTENKINYKKDNIKTISKKFFYSKNDLIQLNNYEDISLGVEIMLATTFLGKAIIALAAQMTGVGSNHNYNANHNSKNNFGYKQINEIEL